MIEVVPFQQHHMQNFVPKTLHKSEMPRTILHEAYTFFNGSTPIAIIGGFFYTNGIFHIWGFISDGVQKEPIGFSKAAKRLLDRIIKNNKPRRLQIDVSVNYPELNRWAEFLGFSREGLMKSYGADGADHYLYARVV